MRIISKIVRKKFDSISNIDYIIEEVSKITKSENSWNKEKEKLYYLMHYHILNNKKSELYAYYRFWGENKIVSQEKEIVNLWGEIRNICSLYLVQGKYRKNLVHKSIEDLYKIKKLEEIIQKNIIENIS